MRRRPIRCAVLLLALGLVPATAPVPAAAVNEAHGKRVVSADPADHTPHVKDGAVLALTQVGNTVVAAGSFTSVSPAGTYEDTSDDVARGGLFAFDATTGAIDPDFDTVIGGPVRSLDTDGTHVFVGGRFTSVDGDPAYRRVVKLTMDGDVVPGFRATPDGEVTEVVVRGSRVYIGGFFKRVTTPAGTVSRKAMAALDRGTGAVVAGFDVPFTGVYDPATTGGGGMTSIKRFDVTADGTRLVAVGNFDRVGGQHRPQVAVIDTGRTPARVTAWRTDRFGEARNSCSRSFNTFTRDVDFSPNGRWFVVTTTGAFAGGAHSGTLCDTVTRWQTNARGNEPRWVAYTGGDTVWGVAVTGAAVYIGGHMRWLNNPFQGDQWGPGAVSRPGIAALDARNGLPLAWNPTRTLGVGAQALLATSAGLWVGSDTSTIGNEKRGRIALLPLVGGSTIPATPRATLPGEVFAAQQRPGGGVLLRRPLRGGGAPNGRPRVADGSINWSLARGAFVLGETLYHGWRNGRFYKRTFDRVTGAVGPREVVDLRPDPDDGTPIPFPVAQVTGMSFDHKLHRLYYTLQDDPGLYYRYFTPESDVVGAQTFVAARRGVRFKHARGLTIASGKLLYGSASGKLRRVRFAGGGVASAPRVLGADRRWTYRAMFVPHG